MTQATAETRRSAGRQQARFFILFLVLLAGGFSLLSLNAVNASFVEPFTAGVARTSGLLLDLLGQQTRMDGTRIFGQRFAVDIRNGCNGLETVVIYAAAVLSFPATWRSRLTGLGLGFLVIQTLNLLRVIALFLTGAYLPGLFASSHTVIWQSVVICCGVLLFVFWAQRYGLRRA
jgi:exosortase H (IPTLxxWG-CTERM-specific)